MTFQEAMAELQAEKWVTRPSGLGELWFIARREAIPAEWIEDWPDEEYFSGNLCEFALGYGELRPDGIGATGFSEEEQAAEDWSVFELARYEDYPEWEPPKLPWEEG